MNGYEKDPLWRRQPRDRRTRLSRLILEEQERRINVVMRDAADLVEIRHSLRQVVNVKGD
jgi:hypothetical protein